MPSLPQKKTLQQLIAAHPLADYAHHSRVHRLNRFSPNYYVKRDDELSFGITGSKIRKYLSLIPSLKAKKVQEAVLIGGASSNNLVGLSQLLIEEEIRPTLFLCGRKPENPSGNFLLSQLLVDQSQIHWHDTECWPIIDQIAEEYAKKRDNCCVIPEGASCSAALPGALTLPLDIVYNEQQQGFEFDHVICDAGTGMMAAVLILGNTLMQRNLHHHVILLADEKSTFLTKLESWKGELEKLFGLNIGAFPPFTTYRPKSARSFGSINAGVKKEIAKLAQEEGILTDPIYSAKLFAEARNFSLEGNVLLIHSGGALGAFSNNFI